MANYVRNTRTQASTDQPDWKADYFLNLYLPGKEAGTRRKLGAIPLRVAKHNENQLIDWLKADPTRVETLLKKLIIEFQSAEPSDSSGFDLS